MVVLPVGGQRINYPADGGDHKAHSGRRGLVGKNVVVVARRRDGSPDVSSPSSRSSPEKSRPRKNVKQENRLSTDDADFADDADNPARPDKIKLPVSAPLRPPAKS